MALEAFIFIDNVFLAKYSDHLYMYMVTHMVSLLGKVSCHPMNRNTNLSYTYLVHLQTFHNVGFYYETFV